MVRSWFSGDCVWWLSESSALARHLQPSSTGIEMSWCLICTMLLDIHLGVHARPGALQNSQRDPRHRLQNAAATAWTKELRSVASSCVIPSIPDSHATPSWPKFARKAAASSPARAQSNFAAMRRKTSANAIGRSPPPTFASGTERAPKKKQHQLEDGRQ
jgi:hypothetical protein